MSNLPSDLKYTESHEWVRIEGDIATIGITDFAQSELGDVVYVSLPEPGRALSKGDVFGAVESVKTASDIYSPLPGEVTEANEKLTAQAELVNSDPYGEGFLIKIKLDAGVDLSALLSSEAYGKLLH